MVSGLCVATAQQRGPKLLCSFILGDYEMSHRFKRQFVCYYHFIGWRELQLGFHVSLSQYNVELHVPFGFVRLGWVRPLDVEECDTRTFGLKDDPRLWYKELDGYYEG